MTRIGILLTTFCVAVLILIPVSSMATTLSVPQTPWPVCSSTVVAFCVESVSIQCWSSRGNSDVGAVRERRPHTDDARPDLDHNQ